MLEASTNCPEASTMFGGPRKLRNLDTTDLAQATTTRRRPCTRSGRSIQRRAVRRSCQCLRPVPRSRADTPACACQSTQACTQARARARAHAGAHICTSRLHKPSAVRTTLPEHNGTAQAASPAPCPSSRSALPCRRGRNSGRRRAGAQGRTNVPTASRGQRSSRCGR